MKHRRFGVLFSACLLLSCSVSGDPRPNALLFVANQMEHSVLLVDPMSKQVLATMGVDINGHEVAVSPDGRFGYVLIYGNTWVGMPGSNGSTIHVVDLRQGRTVAVIDLGKEVRPHSAHFGPDGLLYVSAELANAIYIVDTKTRSLVGEIPTGASHTHMFVFSPDGQRIYTANNEAGSVSVTSALPGARSVPHSHWIVEFPLLSLSPTISTLLVFSKMAVCPSRAVPRLVRFCQSIAIISCTRRVSRFGVFEAFLPFAVS
jgi:DNA-binding beta-propeller fold protein YncE